MKLSIISVVDHYPDHGRTIPEFYREVLGLKEGFRPDFGRPGWWLYTGDHPVLHISLRQIAPTVGPTGSVDHIALNATDWPEMKARLERHQVPWREHGEPREVLGAGVLQDEGVEPL